MQINVMSLPEGDCLEVTRGDALIGYAIKFSGGWDAWALTSNRGRSAISKAARTVAVNTTRDAAIKAIANDWGEEDATLFVAACNEAPDLARFKMQVLQIGPGIVRALKDCGYWNEAREFGALLTLEE